MFLLLRLDIDHIFKIGLELLELTVYRIVVGGLHTLEIAELHKQNLGVDSVGT